jgi:uncharacterized protein YeaO (DUF488 family)
MSKPELRLKRAYEPAAAEDGIRLLVDRLWPRGVSREKLAAEAWLKDIAPSPELRTWFGHRPERWEEFVQRYRAELDDNAAALDVLRGYLRQGPVTLLYATRDNERNSAAVLREYLLRHR